MGLIVATLLALFVPAPDVIPLWPDGAPGSKARRNEAETKPHPWSIGNIYNPSLTVFAPEPGTANGTAVIIAPGGGFRELVVGEEGFKPAQMLAKLGITAFVLKYRLVREEGSGLTIEKDAPVDAVRAVRLVRSRAAEWKIDPKRIGMLGFSAGGEIVSMAALGPLPTTDFPDRIDVADGRPSFAMWIYPGPVGVPEKVTADAPPAFLLVASDDGAVNVVNDLARKYREAKAPAEVHILSGGGHGFNMGDRSNLQAVRNWPQRMVDWLTDRGLLKKLE